MLSKLLQNKYDQALIMVGVGVVITLLQMLGLYIFFKEAYIESRAIINTMNIIAPLLCFGFDSSSPQITKEEKSQSFIWNFIFIQIILMFLFLITIFFVSNQKTINIFMGLTLGAIFSSNILLLEYERNLNKVKNYFFNLHVRDRLNRTIAILLIAYIAGNILSWFILLLLFSILYLVFLALKFKNQIKFDFHKFKYHISLSLPFLIGTIAVVIVYRSAFYVSFYLDNNIYASKVDFWLMLSMFLLLPLINISKYAETEAAGKINKYLSLLKANWTKISTQQGLILIFIFLCTCNGLFFKYIDINDVIFIILPLTSSMLLISLTPSFFYLSLLKKRVILSFSNILIIFIMCSLIYSIKLFVPNFAVAYLLLIISFIYLFYSLVFAKFWLQIDYKNIFRFYDGAKLFILNLIVNLFIIYI